jgi:thioredoxin-related protein
MKKIITILLLSLTLFGANVDDFAKEMGFFRDYKTALIEAEKENKPLMMVLGADYCPWCRKFERNTLSTKMIKTFLDKEVVTLIVDKKYDIDSFPKEFQTQLTPRVFFIDPRSQKSFYDTTGYVKKKEYLKDLEAMKKLYRVK